MKVHLIMKRVIGCKQKYSDHTLQVRGVNWLIHLYFFEQRQG